MTSPLWDFKIFGSGHGMAMPFWNGIFYWLNDSDHEYIDTAGRRHGNCGDFYTFMYGFGAQLRSYQWTHPNAGERRRVAGYHISPLHSTRRWCRVEVAWHLNGLPSDTDGANKMIREFKAALDKGDC